MTTKIEWTDATWNPTTGCTKVSHGCKHCYAERVWTRLVHLPAYAGRDFTDVRTHEDRLDQPLRWRRPRRIFVNSMSDLFHCDVPDSFLDHVFAVMALAHQHTFQILTKRSRRMREYMRDGGRAASVLDLVRNSEIGYRAGGDKLPPLSWPFQNVWMGVSVEDQATADQRIPILLDTPAAVRWISAEPLLGPVDLLKSGAIETDGVGDSTPGTGASFTRGLVDWIVVGGESGPHARPTHPKWVRDMRDQCASAVVPFLFKQWGEWAPNCLCGRKNACKTIDRPQPGLPGVMFRCGKTGAGRLLDEVQHDGYPGDLT